MPWRTIKHEDDRPLLEWQLETLVRGFFDRELLLDYIPSGMRGRPFGSD